MNDSILFFWEWFSINEKYIFDQLEINTDDVAFDIAEQLKLIDENIVFEISFETEFHKRNFVISADGDISLFPLVIEFCGSAPEYERWNIIPFRPRLGQKNQVIDIEGIKLDYDDVYFTYTMEDDYINLEVYIKGLVEDDNRYIHTYFILLDSLIGEFDAVTVIGMTHVFSYVEDDQLLNIRKLIKIVDDFKSRDSSLN